MMSEILVRYLHFIGILVLAATLFYELLTLKAETPIAMIRRLARIDGLYGASAMIVLLAGLALWLWVGKPAAFYADNVLFHIKLGVFVLVAVLSLFPTVFLLRQRNAADEIVRVPKTVLLVLRIEAGMLLLMPLLAVLMARGYGLP